MQRPPLGQLRYRMWLIHLSSLLQLPPWANQCNLTKMPDLDGKTHHSPKFSQNWPSAVWDIACDKRTNRRKPIHSPLPVFHCGGQPDIYVHSLISIWLQVRGSNDVMGCFSRPGRLGGLRRHFFDPPSPHRQGDRVSKQRTVLEGFICISNHRGRDRWAANSSQLDCVPLGISKCSCSNNKKVSKDVSVS